MAIYIDSPCLTKDNRPFLAWYNHAVNMTIRVLKEAKIEREVQADMMFLMSEASCVSKAIEMYEAKACWHEVMGATINVILAVDKE